MAAIRFYPRKTAPLPITFTLVDNGEQVPQFIPGQCICKRCKSRDLTFSAYLLDAKCNACLQYQNEEENLLY